MKRDMKRLISEGGVYVDVHALFRHNVVTRRKKRGNKEVVHLFACDACSNNDAGRSAKLH